MDASSLETQITDLQTAIAADQADLETKQASLASLQSELAQVTFVNQLEALTETDITAINAALLADAANNPLGLSLALPTPPVAATPTEEASS